MSLNNLSKQCILTGRKGAHSTSDFVEIFGAQLGLDNAVSGVNNKDAVIVMMANVLQHLSSKGKFDLRDFR